MSLTTVTAEEKNIQENELAVDEKYSAHTVHEPNKLGKVQATRRPRSNLTRTLQVAF
jgi:hypothetical protein